MSPDLPDVIGRILVDEEQIGAVRAAAATLEGLERGADALLLDPASIGEVAAELRQLVAAWELADKEEAPA